MALRPLPSGGLPQVSFEATRPAVLAPLRTDIAIFLGATQRGPVGTAVRIEGRREFDAVFGGLAGNTDTAHAIHGYFSNGGRIAWVLRLAPGALAARADWDVAGGGGFAPANLGQSRFVLTAASPGRWGDGLSVKISYRRTEDGAGRIDLDTYVAGRLQEQLVGLTLENIGPQVDARSAMIRLTADADALPLVAAPDAGPRVRRWAEISLSGGDDGAAPMRALYSEALAVAVANQEPAMVVLPDLHRHLGADDAAAVLLAAARLCDAKLDRMVIADAPEAIETATEASEWIDRFGGEPAIHRAVASYHPWIEVRDPIGTPIAPFRRLPPSGHVAGAISRLDRERGAYVTPANTSLSDVIDLSRRLTPEVQGALNSMGLNALLCQSARGVVIWGGRMTKSDGARTRFVAHRRLIHRIVRALRRVWEPMVFEPNSDALRFSIARAATTLLLEAFHANVLKGSRPDEAFRVTVDDTLNDQAARDAGRVICEIAMAPAVPMEFIHIRVGLSSDGTIEMVEP